MGHLGMGACFHGNFFAIYDSGTSVPVTTVISQFLNLSISQFLNLSISQSIRWGGKKNSADVSTLYKQTGIGVSFKALAPDQDSQD